MTKRIALMLCLVLAICGSAFAEPAAADAGKALSVKTFQFKHKEADKAAAMIKSLMSADGSISMQPSTNALTVTDRPENLKAITSALAQFDTPPQAFHLTVTVLNAARVAADSAPAVPNELKDVAAQLSMLRFNAFDMLGQATVEGHEGQPGVIDMTSGYRADFKIGDYDPASDTVRIVDFKLSRLQGAEKDQLAALLKTTLNLKVGRTVILGATKVPQSQRALMIVITAKR